ncbi:MAG: S8 family serine peptidase [Gallionella sp.]|nr:S8 family serine peptidase [Gallionella sp.]
MKILQLMLAALLATAVISAEASSAAVAPLHEARSVGQQQITDGRGLVYYIVDLVDDAQEAYSDNRPALARQRFHERHPGKAQNMVEAFERQYGFNYVDMTSWVGNSFSAYLNKAQIENLRADPRVKLISEVVEATFSAAFPPWYNSTISSSQYPYYETHSWGRNAVNGKISNNTRRIYIIDAGVGYHQDLTNVIARVNASCGTNNNGCPGVSPVGCYPHATHVAGIIGAAYGNKGVAGVNAGAKLISVSAMKTNQTPAICAKPDMDSASIVTAMDWVKWDIIINGVGQAGIVNLSINGPGFGATETIGSKMLNLASIYIGGYYYPGAFIAQSAGNGNASACNAPSTASFHYSSGTPSTTDGIMVVGAINDSGYPVTQANGGFYNLPYAGNEQGSNYGSCVEVWAPGNVIYSTWGPNAGYDPYNSSTWQSQSVTYDNYINLSGTSMAAPHITAVAAYLAETQSLGSPGDIETSVRSHFYGTGQLDSAGLPVKLIWLP